MSLERLKGSSGGSVEAPRKIPDLRWVDVLISLKEKIREDNLPLVAAGIAFYGLLALFPGTAVLVSSYGLFADPADIAAHVRAFPGVPDAVKQVLTKHLQELASSSPAALSLGFIGALLFSIWSASRATKALLIAMRIAYDETEAHGFVRRNIIALLVTVAGLIAITFGLLLITILPAGLRHLGLPALQTVAAESLPWLMLIGGHVIGLSLLYRHGPNRSDPKWRWITPGALVATCSWFVASLGFSAYVANFGRYNEAYGAVGAVVVLLLWFWISAFVVLLGAELDAEIERRSMTNADAAT
ncbi:MAG: YihY/virulence factor BrkB family protein [Polyangiales bacterium]